MLTALSLITPVTASDEAGKFKTRSFFVHVHEPLNPMAQDTAEYARKNSSVKSKKYAFFLSLLMPGLGELYQNDWSFKGWGSGLYYFSAEVLLWSGHFYFKSYSGWLREDYRALAARSAGVDLGSPKPSKYYVNIGKFPDLYSYNEFQRRRVGTSALYAETGANFWQWDTEKKRRKYDRMRADSDVFRNYSTYVFWGLFTNHILSAVNSMRIFRNHERLNQTGFIFNMAPNAYRRQTYDVTLGVMVKF